MKTIFKYVLLLLTTAAMMPAQISCSNNNCNGEVCVAEGNVRHVILWTLSDSLSQNEKQEVINLAKSSMEKFVQQTDGLLKGEVIYEKRLESSNCDFMFDMYFKDAKALEEFSVSPEHIATVSSLKQYISERTCLDIAL